ncbi:NADPH-dependent ferric siderophore reductase [Halopolyspora algeriensis]|uniref:NADPH-dependent ferric siderophore reductase n=1 Tax=Halopolyspora algeriensis TaxID=1500506 RepID=A0A368VLQ9_9ACTN|nr:siderophore-interacting protein [Halopolyspora algeriensis]RCW39955.1 NADPH-dependent ferric siderophore reductase [Halopolyspora algeriensis]TQM46608.1 NADPH-dependent ferric siderophore reductase [Halopolyspora algeriensis]
MTATYPQAATRTAPVPAYRAFDVTVSRITRLSPHFIRLTFTGHDLDLFGDTGLDQRIKVVLPLSANSAAQLGDDEDPFGHFPRTEDWYARWRGLPEELRNPLRTYTIRAARPELGEVDVDFVSHGETGVASAWVNRVRTGDSCVLVGPDRRGDSARVGVEWKPGGATTVLLAGDETAVPAISSILAALPAHVCGQAFIEVPAAGDVLPLPAPRGVDITWLPRTEIGEPEDNHGKRLISAVTTGLSVESRRTMSEAGFDRADLDALGARDLGAGPLWETPGSEPGDGMFAWLAGEAHAITTLRRHLVRERGWDRRRVAFMGYWRAGSSGA